MHLFGTGVSSVQFSLCAVPLSYSHELGYSVFMAQRPQLPLRLRSTSMVWPTLGRGRLKNRTEHQSSWSTRERHCNKTSIPKRATS